MKQTIHAGVFVDSALKFEYHIMMIVKKGNQMAALLWGTLRYVDKDMFKAFYKTMIPYLDYTTPVWLPYTWKLVEELERVRQTPRVYHCNQILFGRDQNLKTTKQPPS